MDKDNLSKLVGMGLAAMKAGSRIAAKATDEIQNDAKYPALKEALEEGNQVSKQWAERIDQALSKVGTSGPEENQILQAHYDVSKKIRREAPDDDSRDLGIIAAGQLALHYWIAAFGTIGTYAGASGLSDVAQSMRSSVSEAEQADKQHTELAQRILRA